METFNNRQRVNPLGRAIGGKRNPYDMGNYLKISVTSKEAWTLIRALGDFKPEDEGNKKRRGKLLKRIDKARRNNRA